MTAKTVKVRIALAVDPEGRWTASGGWADSDAESMSRALAEPGDARYWLEAVVAAPEPIPEPQTIQAEARPA